MSPGLSPISFAIESVKISLIVLLFLYSDESNSYKFAMKIKLKKSKIKLLVLYALKKIKYKVSREQLSTVLIETQPINWFELQTVINNLFEDQLIEKDSANKIGLSFRGRQTVEALEDKILNIEKRTIDKYVEDNKDKILREDEIISYYVKEENSYIVELKLMTSGFLLMELKLEAPTKELAQEMCNNWKKSPHQIYQNLLKQLSNKKTPDPGVN